MAPNVLVRIHFYGKGDPKRGFYSSQDSSGDYLKYVDTGSRSGKYRDYVDYAGNREKSSGAFSKGGLLTSSEKKEIREKLRRTDSVVWDSLISFEEKYGKEKMTSWRSAKGLIEKEFPLFLKDNGMDYDNVEWFAALHENTDNRHIHLSFFEDEPKTWDSKKREYRYHKGTLSKDSIDSFKERIEKRMNGHEYGLHQFRDRILEREDSRLIKPDLNAIYESDLKEMLLGLYRILPDGKWGYESHEMDDLRPRIDEITNYMLTSDDQAMEAYLTLIRRLKKRDEETEEICLSQGIDPEGKLISEAFQKDLYRRCGNKILAYLRNAKGRKAEFIKGSGKNQQERWNEKARKDWLFHRTARLNAEVEQEREGVYEAFQRLLAKAEHDRLVEEGVIEAE